MSDLTARLRIEASAAELPAVAKKVKDGLGGVREEAVRTNTALAGIEAGANRAAAGLDRAGDQAQRFDQRARGGASGASMLMAALSAAGIGAFVNDISKAAFAAGGLELGLGAVAGGANNARAELAFVREEAGRLAGEG